MTAQLSRRKSAPLGRGADPRPVQRVPLPSALDGRRYRILDAGDTQQAWVERIGPSNGRMQVPLGSAGVDRRIRLHEMAHVRWTPANPAVDGASPMTVNAIEDRRIHKRLHDAGIGRPLTDAPLWEDDGPEWDGLDARIGATPGEEGFMSDLDVARFAAASDLTSESRQYRQIVRDNGRAWILGVVDGIMDRHGLNDRRPAWKRTVEAAIELDAIFADPPPLDEAARTAMESYPDEADGPAGWGEMTIETPALPDRLPASMRARKRRASDTGAVPRNWSRLVSDQRVFTSRQKRPGGGTVLIDQSGSMGLDPSEVMALIERFPAVTIATYAGSGRRGRLRIIARNGRRAAESDCFLGDGGNTVDGPALDWLNDQTAPRIWVSDGYVTGVGNHCTPTLIMDAARKCQTGNVQRFDRLGELLDGGEGHA